MDEATNGVTSAQPPFPKSPGTRPRASSRFANSARQRGHFSTWSLPSLVLSNTTPISSTVSPHTSGVAAERMIVSAFSTAAFVSSGTCGSKGHPAARSSLFTRGLGTTG